MENDKFLGFSGVLNRRHFIINFLIVSIIEVLFYVTPVLTILFLNTDLLVDIATGVGVPVWLILWTFIAGLLKLLLICPSVYRRASDISSKNAAVYTSLIMAVMVISVFANIKNSYFSDIIKIINFILIILLMCVKGESPSTNDNIAKFNWGAFLGTWIWGLYNKCYKTLFMIPLLFTPAGLHFALICGLKGNEWAYEAVENDDIPKFHKSQSSQAVFWAIFGPILYVICIAASLIIAGYALNQYQKSHPDFINQLNAYNSKMEQSLANSYFEKIESDNGVYNFYLNPKAWAKMSGMSKYSMIETAINYTLNNKSDKSEKPMSSSKKVMTKIRILSTFNNEILGEFEFDESEYNNVVSKSGKYSSEAAKITKQGYKINNNPTLP